MRKKLLEQINRILIQITYLRKALIYKKCKDFLGLDFTPRDTTPDIVACAEAVTTLLVACGAFPRVITGTYTLWEQLNWNRNWTMVSSPEKGDIIISPTGLGGRGRIGHVGIVGENGLVFSNDSYTGLWSTHYTVETWRNKYYTFPVYYYRYISVV